MNVQSKLRHIQNATSSFIDVARLSTNTTTRSHPVHNWFNFIAGFSPELVQACLSITDRPANTLRLLDPFSGCGTAPLAARLSGAHAYAYEPHPFFATISEAKANSPNYFDDLDGISASIERGINSHKASLSDFSDSANIFLSKMFSLDALVGLLSVKNALAEDGFSNNPMAFLILSRMLDYCCFSATDGIYKAPTSPKSAISPSLALSRVLSGILSDRLAGCVHPNRAHIYASSSEDMSGIPDRFIDLVVTSPPYLNNFDFAEMTRMYLYFWGLASSWGDITEKVRSKLVVNTTTALKGHKDKQEMYRSTLPDWIQDEVDPVVSTLQQRRSEKAGKKEYDLIVYPYLSQMKQILTETLRTLKPGAHFHMMVSDAALYGTHIPAPRWLAEIMQDIGFYDVQYEMLRPRGHRWVLEKREGAAEGLGEYYVHGQAR